MAKKKECIENDNRCSEIVNKTVNKNQLKKRRDVDYIKALDLYLEGMSITDICKFIGITRKTFYDKFNPIIKLIKDKDIIRSFNDKRSLILDTLELTLLDNMGKKDKIDKASINNLAYAFDKIYNASRLEKNLSTSNTLIKQETFVKTVGDIIKDKRDKDNPIEYEQI